LSQEPDIEVVAEAGDGSAALDAALDHEPDLLILDIDMPGTQSFEVAKDVKTRLPGTQVLFLSAFFHDTYIQQALTVEAGGYVTKDEPPETVIDAIRQIAAGSVYYSQQVQSRIVIGTDGACLAETTMSRAATLTPRELEVLRYIARGLSKKEIAATMHLSVSTIDAHTARLMNRLAIHDRVALALFAVREGLAEP
jgi:DNA-binding NarL/FixJ family response regulator